MSEDSVDQPTPAEAPATKVARKRPSVRKAAKAKPAPEAEAAPTPAVVEAPAPAAPAEPRPERKEQSVPAEIAASSSHSEGGSDGHDAGRIALLVETPAGEPGGNSKKRRRRKKKHGQQGAQGQPQGNHSHSQQQHPHAVVPHGEAPPQASQQTSEHAHAPAAQAMHAAPRPKLDPEQVAKKAWKIFQAEVGEEGLALIDDHDAREISRRCFRLAEIFLEEAARRNR
ncbi:hypothetical protein [Luteolibacter luteus]|uniref:Uncharacterized protein n=1 Tax=Luteolibacter luteus TaxID=2728835 RepID=A0A858RQ23_9BACT|nr:hypothetical protein [Luteolibacter luteus]QJE98498.1 hypothetical protein HHL09_22825 [Luteolibacter luteus]